VRRNFDKRKRKNEYSVDKRPPTVNLTNRFSHGLSFRLA
jgi:hypothetical protein